MAKIIEQSSAEKLARLQLGFIEQHNKATATLDAATAIARSVEPLPFDECAARAQVTDALAADAMNGSQTAEAVKQGAERARSEADDAIAAHRTGKEQARTDCERLTAEIKEVDEQIRQLDMSIRKELVTLALADSKLMRASIIKDGEALLEKMMILQAVDDVTGIDQLDPYGKQLDGITPAECTIGLPFKTEQYHYLMQQGHRNAEVVYQNRMEYLNHITGGVWPASMKPLHEQVYFAK